MTKVRVGIISLRKAGAFFMAPFLLTMLVYGTVLSANDIPACDGVIGPEVTLQAGIGLAKAKQTVIYREKDVVIRISRITHDTFVDDQAIFVSMSQDLVRRTMQSSSMIVREYFGWDKTSGILAYVPKALDLPSQLDFTAVCVVDGDVIFFRGLNSNVGALQTKLKIIKMLIIFYLQSN